MPALKFEKEINKLCRRILRFLEYRECSHSMSVLVRKEWQRNEQRVIKHACSVHPLHSFPLPLWFPYLKNWIHSKKVKSQTSTKQTKAQTKKKKCRKNDWRKHLHLETKTYNGVSPYLSPFHLSQLWESRSGCAARIARATSSEELGIMSKNNLRGNKS